jgi:hypothetical protein
VSEIDAEEWPTPEELVRWKAKWERLGTPEGLIENALKIIGKACRRAREDLEEAKQLLDEETSSS